MTIQEPEILFESIKCCQMLNYPLNEYFSINGTPPFQMRRTSIRRGYVGTWRIQDQKLLLEGINGDLEDGTKFNAETYFGKDLPIHAEWFNGTIYLAQGKMIRVKGSFNPIYEMREEITLEYGGVIKRVMKQYNAKQESYIEI
ncbi:MAG: hypothetical protein ACXAD7_01835 [Candidatus Kariarchaeaceae archaeon]|jgi:hypothetical protein